MEQTIKFVHDNADVIGLVLGGVYELAVRLTPSKKNRSIIDLVFKVLSFVVPNRQIKNILIWLAFLAPLFTYAQTESNFNAAYSWKNGTQDTTNIINQRLYKQIVYGNAGGLYFNKITNKWRVWAGTCSGCAVDSAWVDLLGSSSSSSLYFKNGLTKRADSTTVELGGPLIKNTTISGHYNLTFNNDQINGSLISVYGNSDKRVSIGLDATANGSNASYPSVAIGSNATADNLASTAVGASAGSTSGANEITAIGFSANGGSQSTTIGSFAQGSANTVTIGRDSKSLSGGSVSVGYQAGNNSGPQGGGAISLGYYAGIGSAGLGTNSTSIGFATQSKGANSITMGSGTGAGSELLNTVDNSFALGFSSTTPDILFTKNAGWLVGGGYGTSGQALVSNGTGGAPTWQTVGGGGGSPAGSTKQIQYNLGGAFAAESPFTYSQSNNTLRINGTNGTDSVTVNGSGVQVYNGTTVGTYLGGAILPNSSFSITQSSTANNVSLTAATNASVILNVNSGSSFFKLTDVGGKSDLSINDASICGTGNLNLGSVTIPNTRITANSRIFVTSNVDSGTPGWLRVSSRVNGTSFTVTSSSVTDNSTFAYFIIQQ